MPSCRRLLGAGGFPTGGGSRFWLRGTHDETGIFDVLANEVSYAEEPDALTLALDVSPSGSQSLVSIDGSRFEVNRVDLGTAEHDGNVQIELGSMSCTGGVPDYTSATQILLRPRLPRPAGLCDIDSETGASLASGGDIPRADTHTAAAKTLGLALGIDAALLDPDFTDNGTIKPVKAAVVTG